MSKTKQSKTCNDCTYYKSYRDDFFGDELEPDDQGFCKGGEPNDGHTFGEFDACKSFEQKNFKN